MQRDPIRKALEQSEFFEGIGPEELQTALEGAGIRAALLSAKHLGDTEQFTAERFPLLANL